MGLGFTDFGKLNDLAEQLYDDDKNYDKRFIEAAKEIYKETGEFNSHLVFPAGILTQKNICQRFLNS